MRRYATDAPSTSYPLQISPSVSFWRPQQGLWSVIASFPLVLSSYVGHFNIFKIEYELKHRYHADMSTTTMEQYHYSFHNYNR